MTFHRDSSPAHRRASHVQVRLSLGVEQPYILGLAACRSKGVLASLCHAAGGAGYALSRAAAAALHRFHDRGPDQSYTATVERSTYGGEDVSVAYALRREAGATLVNCGSFYQMRPDMYAFLPTHQTDGVRWPLSATPISFHVFKHSSWVHEFHSCALYTPAGAPRCFLPDVATLLANGTCAPPLNVTPAACAAATAALPPPQRPSQPASDGDGSDAGTRAQVRTCEELQSCAACTAHEPLPPPRDLGVRCVWCRRQGACRGHVKVANALPTASAISSARRFPCEDATRPGGGYPGGRTC